MQTRDVDTIELHLKGRCLWSLHDLTQGSSQRNLVAEVDVSLFQEFLHFRTCGMEAGQDGEDRFFAFADLLIEHIVGLIELGEARGAVDDGNGINLIELVLAVVDDLSKLFWCASGEEIDGIGDRRTREQLGL